MNVRYDMVTCFVVRPSDQGELREFLQLRRAPGEFLEGAWGAVHGRIERGETAWQAALRELREEAGLAPDEFYQLDTINQFYLAADDTVWHVPAFCAVVPRDVEVTLNDEHDAVRWLPRDRFDKDFLWPGERHQVAELAREIFDGGPAKAYLKIHV
ncbi:MAG TPA: NUDIX domain-containing protein [Tepidisphaeraceae bacterium]|nr:NUDIX domain-containing protein [Tepidisphaeraceae bacterium]